MGRPRLPLSASERTLYRPTLIFALFVCALGLGVATLALSVGRVTLGALVVLPAVVIIAAVWSIRLRVMWLTTALIAAGFVTVGYLAGHLLLGAVIAALVAGWLARKAHVRLDTQTIKLVSADAMDPLSAAHVAAFESLGFERAGVISFEPSSDTTIVATVLIGPERDRYAVATNTVLTVESVFGQRVLTTKNSGVVSLPPEILANDLRGADANELFDAHEAALAILRARGLTPDRIRPGRLLELHMGIERRAIEWTNSRSWRQAFETFTGSGKGAGALDEGPASLRRIDAWLSAPAPIP